MIIRKAKKDDIKEVIKLTKIPELDNPKSGSNLESFKYFQEYMGKGIFLVAEEDGKIVGFITGEFMLGSYIYIDVLSVDSTLRGKGIGKDLVRNFEKLAKKKGVKFVHLTAPKFNKKTVKFYEKNGYDKGKEFFQFYKKL